MKERYTHLRSSKKTPTASFDSGLKENKKTIGKGSDHIEVLT